jgi:F-type H+-transporting ATPase subunit delta
VRDGTVARKYAETLFELGVKHDRPEEYGEAISMVADLLDAEASFRVFLETPRIAAAAKKDLVRETFGTKLPKHVVNFVLVCIDKRRQRLLREIASQYGDLLDAHLGRERVEVTVARPMDEETRNMITGRLTEALGRQAIPQVRVRPEILGGLVVRTGDTIYDGSIRSRLERLRGRMLQAQLPARAAASDR